MHREVIDIVSAVVAALARDVVDEVALVRAKDRRQLEVAARHPRIVGRPKAAPGGKLAQALYLARRDRRTLYQNRRGGVEQVEHRDVRSRLLYAAPLERFVDRRDQAQHVARRIEPVPDGDRQPAVLGEAGHVVVDRLDRIGVILADRVAADIGQPHRVDQTDLHDVVTVRSLGGKRARFAHGHAEAFVSQQVAVELADASVLPQDSYQRALLLDDIDPSRPVVERHLRTQAAGQVDQEHVRFRNQRVRRRHREELEVARLLWR